MTNNDVNIDAKYHKLHITFAYIVCIRQCAMTYVDGRQRPSTRVNARWGTSTRVNGRWRASFSGRQRPLTCAVWMGLYA